MEFVEELLTNYNLSESHTANLIQTYLGATLEYNCNALENAVSLSTLFANILQDGFGLSIKAGLEKANSHLSESSCYGSDPDRKNVVLIIASGIDDATHDPPRTVLDAANALKNQGVEIHAIGVENADRDQLEQITGSPSRVTMFPFFQNLTKVHVNYFVNRLLAPEG